MQQISANRILVSRTDSIGDVVLTLPICGWIKQHFPNCELIFLGRSYTQPVVECFSVVDRFVDWNAIEALPTVEKLAFFRELNADVCIHVFPNKEVARLAKRVKIPHRIGTSHRSFHLTTCNHRMHFSRKRSPLHEAQLNFELLRPLGLTKIPSVEELIAYTSYFQLPDAPLDLKSSKSSKRSVILHPKSQGSAVEWPIAHYIELAEKLVSAGCQVYFSGTDTEGKLFREAIPTHLAIHDITGTMDLSTFISFILGVDVLVACSTGPLHIAATCGIRAVGLYSPRRPIHPGRWMPIGAQVSVLTYDDQCPTCLKGKSCECIAQIPVERVFQTIVNQLNA